MNGIQWREEMEYQAGMASEYQNAFHISCIDRRPDDKGRIAELVAAGRFCLIAWNVEFCRFTDAILPGRREILIADFSTQREAEEHWHINCPDVDCDEEAGYDILPRRTEL